MIIRRHLVIIVCLAIAMPGLARPTGLARPPSATGPSSALGATRWPARGSLFSSAPLALGPGVEAVRVSADSRDNAIEAAVQRARQAWTSFDYKGALSVLEQASGAAQDSPILLAAYGSVYLKAEEPERAREYLDRAVRLDRACAEALLGEGEARLLDRDYAAAEDWLNRLLSIEHVANGTLSRAHTLLARISMETGNRAQAEAEALKAIDADAQNADALYLSAFIKAAERKPALVRSLARRALEINPNLTSARRLLSQYVNGSAGYEQQVDVSARHHFEEGKALEDKGSIREALAEFEAAARAEPRYYRALIAIASIRLGEHAFDRALSAARRAVEVDPEGAI